MITRSPDNDLDNAQEQPPRKPASKQGVVAPQPFPDQEARRRMSEQATAHPSKRMRNRDWKRVPRGSLATDP